MTPSESLWTELGWDGLNWKECYAKLGVTVWMGGLDLLLVPGVLLVTNCNQDKSTILARATPKELYPSRGKAVQRVVRFAEQRRVPYGILSLKYGLIYWDEVVDGYDTSPGEVANYQHIGELAAGKLTEREITKVVYYCPSPLRARPFIELLYRGGVDVVYVTKLVDERFV